MACGTQFCHVPLVLKVRSEGPGGPGFSYPKGPSWFQIPRLLSDPWDKVSTFRA